MGARNVLLQVVQFRPPSYRTLNLRTYMGTCRPEIGFQPKQMKTYDINMTKYMNIYEHVWTHMKTYETNMKYIWTPTNFICVYSSFHILVFPICHFVLLVLFWTTFEPWGDHFWHPFLGTLCWAFVLPFEFLGANEKTQKNRKCPYFRRMWA